MTLYLAHHGLQSTDVMDWTDYFYAVRPNGRTGPDLGSPFGPDWATGN